MAMDDRRRREADTIVHDLAHAASDEAAAACLRGALEDGHERVLVPRLHAYIVARDAEIESLCERHYSEFLGSARAPRARRSLAHTRPRSSQPREARAAWEREGEVERGRGRCEW